MAKKVKSVLGTIKKIPTVGKARPSAPTTTRKPFKKIGVK